MPARLSQLPSDPEKKVHVIVKIKRDSTLRLGISNPSNALVARIEALKNEGAEIKYREMVGLDLFAVIATSGVIKNILSQVPHEFFEIEARGSDQVLNSDSYLPSATTTPRRTPTRSSFLNKLEQILIDQHRRLEDVVIGSATENHSPVPNYGSRSRNLPTTDGIGAVLGNSARTSPDTTSGWVNAMSGLGSSMDVPFQGAIRDAGRAELLGLTGFRKEDV